MLESLSYTPREERQSLRFHIRQYAAAAVAVIAGVVPIQTHETVTWSEEESYTEVMPARSHTFYQDTTKTAILDESNEEIDRDRLPEFMTFEIDDDSEKEDFIDAVTRIIDPTTPISVEVDGPDVLLKTDDFAKHKSDKIDAPTDEQSSTLEVNIDGKLVYASGRQFYTQTYPPYEVQRTRNKVHSFSFGSYRYQEATLPETPSVKEQPRPIKIKMPRSVIYVNDTSNSTETEDGLDIISDSPVSQTIDSQPASTEELTHTRPEEILNSEEIETEQNTEQEQTIDDSGSSESVSISNAVPEIVQDITQKVIPEVRLSVPSLTPRYNGLRMSMYYRARLKKIIAPIVAVAALLGGAYGLNRLEFESIEDCRLGTPEQPFDITKNTGEWLPEISKPDCPSPKGHVIRIKFGDFKDGYGIGKLDSSSNIKDIKSVPNRLIPDFIKDHFIGDKFSNEVKVVIGKLDKARKNISEQTEQPYNDINF